jgi:hypothetical protein
MGVSPGMRVIVTVQSCWYIQVGNGFCSCGTGGRGTAGFSPRLDRMLNEYKIAIATVNKTYSVVRGTVTTTNLNDASRSFGQFDAIASRI